MLLIDDILCFPVTGILTIFRELHKAVEQESVNEGEAIRAELSALYLLLETGQLGEQEFDAREKDLLDRLDVIESRGQDAEEAEEADASSVETEEDAELDGEDAPVLPAATAGASDT